MLLIVFSTEKGNDRSNRVLQMGIRNHTIPGIDRHTSHRRPNKTATSSVLTATHACRKQRWPHASSSVADSPKLEQQDKTSSAPTQLGREEVDQPDQGREAQRLVAYHRRYSDKIHE